MSKVNEGNVKLINLYFVLRAGHLDEGNVSIEMKSAFSIATDWNSKPRWIKEEDCAIIDSSSMGNVFVFEEFSGTFFMNFVNTHRHARIVGPKCLCLCFAEKMSIPYTKSPIYNLALNGVLIATFIESADKKKRIFEWVGYMGGDCTDVLTRTRTHLVVSSIMSDVYFIANEVGIPIMRSDWIQHVWQRSLVSDINGTSEELVEEYKCPMFYKLVITTSQLNDLQKGRIKTIIENGGGTYSGDLENKVTNLLIIRTGRGEKFKFATRWNIKCVTPAWLEQCLLKGYAVRFDKFIVQPENKCSTPVGTYNHAKLAHLVDTNDTDISVIPSGNNRIVVTESAYLDTQTQNEPVLPIGHANIFKTPVKNTLRNENANISENPLSYRNVLDAIKMNDVKKCQHLLDGCKVYLSGFNANEEEKLRRVLNHGGAIRFIDLNESVTHVIVGNPNNAELEALKRVSNKPHIVKLDWLSSSISKGSLEREDNCAFFNENNESSHQSSAPGIQQPSPLSKKGLQMLNPVRHIPISTHPIPGIDQILIEKYATPYESISENHALLAKNVTPNSINEEPQQNGSSFTDKLFQGLRFAVIGHTEGVSDAIKTTLCDYGGTVISSIHSVADYSVVPFTNTTAKITSNEVVTVLWIQECLASETVIETKYYHKPVTLSDMDDATPLNDCVITFSSFNTYEKQYLDNIAGFLGAKSQDVLSKKLNKEKNIAQTTHLVCSLTDGAKYVAAKKWNLPIVSKNWLLCCFNSGTKLPVEDYALTNDLQPATVSSFSSTKISNKPKNKRNVTNNHENFTKTTEKCEIATKTLSKTTITANITTINKASSIPINVSSDVTSHSSNTKQPNNNVHVDTSAKSPSKLSFKLNTKPTAAERKPVFTPSIAEAVQRSTLRNAMMNNNQNPRSEATITKNWPTGFLLEINACASSSVKRKLDCQPVDAHISPQDCQRNKLLRYENTTSSPYEEVGWQDTLTDLSNIQIEHPDSNDKSSSTTSKSNKSCNASPVAENRVLMAQNEIKDESSVTNANGKIVNTACSRVTNLMDKNSKHSANVYGNFLISMPNVADLKIKEITLGESSQCNLSEVMRYASKNSQWIKPFERSTRRNLVKCLKMDMNEKRAHYEQTITKLGGRVLAVFSTDCSESEKATHIIIDELKKTEKLLCSIASGIWVLQSSYIEQCAEAQKFLPEENFEWGNPLTEKFLKKSSKEFSAIARAAHRWRITIAKKGSSSKPFVGMKAVILSTPNDEAVHSLIRVVESGGGSVLPTCDILNCTHCLLKSPKLELVPVPLKQLADRKIHCLLAVYLSDLLTNDPPPDVKTCYLEPYKRLF